jgi:hypothetical protein
MTRARPNSIGARRTSLANLVGHNLPQPAVERLAELARTAACSDNRPGLIEDRRYHRLADLLKARVRAGQPVAVLDVAALEPTRPVTLPPLLAHPAISLPQPALARLEQPLAA